MTPPLSGIVAYATAAIAVAKPPATSRTVLRSMRMLALLPTSMREGRGLRRGPAYRPRLALSVFLAQNPMRSHGAALRRILQAVPSRGMGRVGPLCAETANAQPGADIAAKWTAPARPATTASRAPIQALSDR